MIALVGLVFWMLLKSYYAGYKDGKRLTEVKYSKKFCDEELLTDDGIDDFARDEYPMEKRRANELAWCVKKYRDRIKKIL